MARVVIAGRVPPAGNAPCALCGTPWRYQVPQHPGPSWRRWVGLPPHAVGPGAVGTANPAPRAGLAPCVTPQWVWPPSWAQWALARPGQVPYVAGTPAEAAVLDKWGRLIVHSYNTTRVGVVGAFIKRLEWRWHSLGVRLRKARFARWFRDRFLTPECRRAWKPVRFRWWGDDRRLRTHPDEEWGPDPDPFWDWPNSPFARLLARAEEVE